MDSRRTILCLPTYNEAENLHEMVRAVQRHVPSVHILVIDDNSPDGTGAIADRLADADPRIRVLHRAAKEGLGRAYIAGFRHVLADSDVSVIIQMDADGSHPVERLPALVEATNHADLVIGSRYVSGGGTENWGWARRQISRFGAFYARLCLGLPVRDPTGGFKAWRADLLRRVLAYPIDAGGYAFQIETSHIARRLGATIQEIPIRFVDRRVGQSKMSTGIALEAFWKVPRMRWRHARTGQPGAPERIPDSAPRPGSE